MPKIEISIPEDFLCPITHQLMTDPVATADGHVYQREAIQRWLQDNKTGPITNLPLKHTELIAIPFVKKQVQSFLEKHKLCTEKEFFAAIDKVIMERDTVFKVQKLNYLASYLEAKDEFSGDTVLHRAASLGHNKLVAWLLAEGANPNAKNNYGITPLHVAMREKTVRFLLAAGANLDAKDNKGRTPLHYATSRRNVEVVRLFLLEGADPMAIDNRNCTPHILQSINDSGEGYVSSKAQSDNNRIDYLLLSKASNSEAEYGSKLHLAIEYNQIEEVKYLLWAMRNHEEEIDLEAKNRAGYTALTLAVSCSAEEIVKLLLKQNVNLEARVEMGYGFRNGTSLHLAASGGKRELVQLLLEYGANANALDSNRLTPAQVAEKNGKIETVKLFQLYEAPKKIAVLENLTQQQSLLIQAMQTQITELTRQLQQLTGRQQNNTGSKKYYKPSFNYTNKG